MSLDVLFEPLRLGNMTTRNRIVSLPHGNSYGLRGVPDAMLPAYLGRVASGSAGLIVIGASAIHPTTFRPPLFSLFDDRAMPRLREMVATVHSAGSLIVCQLGHSGRHAAVATPGVAVWAPSPEPPGPQGYLLRSLGNDDLGEIRAAYVGAAERALAAGFDGVEVHSAHSYLMQQFLSPFYNRRNDAYGGPIEGRMRLLSEVLGRLREIASERLLGIRLGAGDDRPGGLEWEDVLEVGRRLGAAALVDYISLSVPARSSRYVKDETFPRGGMRERSAALKSAARVPVIVSQRIDTPELAAEILHAGQADLIGLARELVADPEWGAKARSGDSGAIRPCVICMDDCRRSAISDTGMVSCAVNPGAYRAVPTPPSSVAAGMRVVVVGAGPAGCGAAVAAAERGASVVLFERSGDLGGSARLAGRAPYRAAWGRYADHLARLVARTRGIDVRLATEADEGTILDARPRVVIIATGAVMPHPRVDGHSAISTYALLALDRAPAWSRALVIDPYGRWDAVNAVDVLVGSGSAVTYVTPLERVADRVPEESRDGILERFATASVRCYTASRFDGDGSLRVVRAFREPVPLEAQDGIVVAGELASEAASQKWRLPGIDVRRIGDALAPRGTALATREGVAAGDLLEARG